MLVAEVTEAGEILGCRRYATGDREKGDLIDLLIRGVREYAREVGWKSGSRPEQIGVGINGVVDPEAGIWKKIGDGDCDFPVRQTVEEALGIRCFVDNDVKCTVMAENRFGAGKGCKDMVYVNVGTGLAAGIISGGKVIRGTDGFAGEVGFMNFTEGIGKRVEMLASGMGIRDRARELADRYPESLLARSVASGVTGQELFAAAAKGDAMANCILDTLIRMTGLLISNLVCVLSPEMVVLGGGLISDETVLDRIRETVSPKARQHLERGILLTQLNPDYAGLMGAAAVGLGLQEEYG